MMQRHKKFDTVILAIFGPADPVRQILRDYAACQGLAAYFYDHLLDAISRMPLDNASATLVLARPEGFSAAGMAAFDMLLAKPTTHYALWLENGDARYAAKRCPWPAALHAIENLHELDLVLSNLQNTPHHPSLSLDNEPPVPCRRPLDIPRQPLSSEELEALLEIGL